MYRVQSTALFLSSYRGAKSCVKLLQAGKLKSQLQVSAELPEDLAKYKYAQAIWREGSGSFAPPNAGYHDFLLREGTAVAV